MTLVKTDQWNNPKVQLLGDGVRMRNEAWFKYFPGAIIVTDENAIIVEMNDASAEKYKEDGGFTLIGQNVIDCHPKSIQDKIHHIYESKKPNVYLIQNHGEKILIYQTPYVKDGKFAGVVEISLPLPEEFQYLDRD